MKNFPLPFFFKRLAYSFNMADKHIPSPLLAECRPVKRHKKPGKQISLLAGFQVFISGF